MVVMNSGLIASRRPGMTTTHWFSEHSSRWSETLLRPLTMRNARRYHGTSGISETRSWGCCGGDGACGQRDCGAAAADPCNAGCAPACQYGKARARYKKRGRSSQTRAGSLGAPLASALASASLGLAALAPSSLASSLASPSLVRWFVRGRITLLQPHRGKLLEGKHP